MYRKYTNLNYSSLYYSTQIHCKYINYNYVISKSDTVNKVCLSELKFSRLYKVYDLSYSYKSKCIPLKLICFNNNN